MCHSATDPSRVAHTMGASHRRLSAWSRYPLMPISACCPLGAPRRSGAGTLRYHFSTRLMVDRSLSVKGDHTDCFASCPADGTALGTRMSVSRWTT
jgi:hypothetical protein